MFSKTDPDVCPHCHQRWIPRVYGGKAPVYVRNIAITSRALLTPMADHRIGRSKPGIAIFGEALAAARHRPQQADCVE